MPLTQPLGLWSCSLSSVVFVAVKSFIRLFSPHKWCCHQLCIVYLILRYILLRWGTVGDFGCGVDWLYFGVYALLSGIIDPTKVVKTALSDASSVASLMATTEASIVDAPEKSPQQADGMGAPGGGMPMGGMF